MCKSFLIATFRKTPEFYLDQLNVMIRSGTDSYSLFLNKLAEVHGHYLNTKQVKSFDELRDDCILNFFMNSLKPEISEFVKAIQPKSSAEAAAASADLYFSIHGTTNQSQRKGYKMENRGDKKSCDRTSYVPNPSHQESQSPVRVVGESKVQSTGGRPQTNQSGAVAKQAVRCFRCNLLGHKSYDCPQKSNTTVNGMQTSQHTAFVKGVRVPSDKYVIPVYINGEPQAHVAYRDTGTSLSLCDSRLLNDTSYNGKTVEIQGVTGYPVTLKLANILIEAPHFKCNRPIKIEVAAMQTLPFGVELLLGNKMFELNANDISDVVYVDQTYRERPQKDTEQSHAKLMPHRIRTGKNDVIIINAERKLLVHCA